MNYERDNDELEERHQISRGDGVASGPWNWISRDLFHNTVNDRDIVSSESVRQTNIS